MNAAILLVSLFSVNVAKGSLLAEDYDDLEFDTNGNVIEFSPGDINECILELPKTTGNGVVSYVNLLPGGQHVTKKTSAIAGWFGYGSLTETVSSLLVKPVTMKQEQCPDSFGEYGVELILNNVTTFIPGLTSSDKKIFKTVVEVSRNYDPEKGNLKALLHKELAKHVQKSGSKLSGDAMKSFVDHIVPGGEILTSATSFIAKSTTGKDTLTEVLVDNMTSYFQKREEQS